MSKRLKTPSGNKKASYLGECWTIIFSFLGWREHCLALRINQSSNQAGRKSVSWPLLCSIECKSSSDVQRLQALGCSRPHSVTMVDCTRMTEMQPWLPYLKECHLVLDRSYINFGPTLYHTLSSMTNLTSLNATLSGFTSSSWKYLLPKLPKLEAIRLRQQDVQMVASDIPATNILRILRLDSCRVTVSAFTGILNHVAHNLVELGCPELYGGNIVAWTRFSGVAPNLRTLFLTGQRNEFINHDAYYRAMFLKIPQLRHLYCLPQVERQKPEKVNFWLPDMGLFLEQKKHVLKCVLVECQSARDLEVDWAVRRYQPNTPNLVFVYGVKTLERSPNLW